MDLPCGLRLAIVVVAGRPSRVKGRDAGHRAGVGYEREKQIEANRSGCAKPVFGV